MPSAPSQGSSKESPHWRGAGMSICPFSKKSPSRAKPKGTALRATAPGPALSVTPGPCQGGFRARDAWVLLRPVAAGRTGWRENRGPTLPLAGRASPQAASSPAVPPGQPGARLSRPRRPPATRSGSSCGSPPPTRAAATRARARAPGPAPAQASSGSSAAEG